jgi:hypothetical protein
MTFIVLNATFIVTCRYHGKKERQKMCVIVWPQAHKSLYAASSHIQKQRTSPSHTTRNSTSCYFLPQWKCYNCIEIRRDTSGTQKGSKIFNLFHLFPNIWYHCYGWWIRYLKITIHIPSTKLWLIIYRTSGLKSTILFLVAFSVTSIK